MEAKQCSKCDVVKPVTDFTFRNANKGTRHSYCRPCYAEYQRQHYRRNKRRYVDKAVRYRLALKDEIRQLKEATPCDDCGGLFPYYVTDYDHRDGTLKRGLVSRLVQTAGRKGVMIEITKCDLVCSNCHRVRTHLRARSLGVA